MTDEEMEHYLWFPELYCKRCSKPIDKPVSTEPLLCDACLDVLAENETE